MDDYVFLDTNIWVYCCLDSQENFSHSALVKISQALDIGAFKLVVPETVDAELSARLDEHFKTLREYLNKAKLAVNFPYPTHKKRLEDSIDKQIEDVGVNFKKSKKEIARIFSHKNTVRLKLNSDIFTSAYMRCLKRRRPYRAEKVKRQLDGDGQLRLTETQNDAVIIEELIAHFSKLSDYTLYIGNYDKDYIDESTNKLHGDIKADLPNAELYQDLTELLKMVKVTVRTKTAEYDEKLKQVSSFDATFIGGLINTETPVAWGKNTGGNLSYLSNSHPGILGQIDGSIYTVGNANTIIPTSAATLYYDSSRLAAAPNTIHSFTTTPNHPITLSPNAYIDLAYKNKPPYQ